MARIAAHEPSISRTLVDLSKLETEKLSNQLVSFSIAGAGGKQAESPFLILKLGAEKNLPALIIVDKKTGLIVSDDYRASVNQTKVLGKAGVLEGSKLDTYFSKRSEPLQKAETQHIAAIKESVSALSGAGKDSPYKSVHKLSDGEYAIGRYGATQQLLRDWLKMHFGQPLDFTKAEDMVAAGILPREFARKEYRKGFLDLMLSLDGRNGRVDPAKVEKYFPPLLQETIATDMTKYFQRTCKNDVGRVALSLVLGRAVTDKEMKDPRFTEFTKAGSTLYGLAQIKKILNRSESIDFSVSAYEESTTKGRKLAAIAHETATSISTVGKCQMGVETTMKRAGIEMRKFPDAKSAVSFYARDKRFAEVPADRLQPGDVVVRGATTEHPFGHTFVYLGKGMEASDHVQKLSRASAYGPSRAFRLIA